MSETAKSLWGLLAGLIIAAAGVVWVGFFARLLYEAVRFGWGVVG